MTPTSILQLLDDTSIAAEERLQKALASKEIPPLVLLQFACDCAANALNAEQQALRAPEGASLAAVQRVEEWLEQCAQPKPESEREIPPSPVIFSSIRQADAILKHRFAPANQLGLIAIDARKAVESWEAKAPAFAAEAAAILAEMAADVATAEDDAKREWRSEEHWTDTEFEWAMQAAAARGPEAWTAKSELDSTAIARRLVHRQMSSAIHAAREVCRLAADRAAAHQAQEAESKNGDSSTLGAWFRSLWGSKKSAATPAAAESQTTASTESARKEEVIRQIAQLRELLSEPQ